MARRAPASRQDGETPVNTMNTKSPLLGAIVVEHGPDRAVDAGETRRGILTLRPVPYASLVSFFVLVFVLEWLLAAPLAGRNPAAVGLIVIAPTVAAVIVVAATEGRRGIWDWVRRCFKLRASAASWAAAATVPVAITATAALSAYWLGHSPRYSLSLLAILPATIILAAFEEFGWRGFALPRLLDVMQPLPVALLFGTIHALFHLPMFLLALPEAFRQASPFWLFAAMVIAYSTFGVAIFVRSHRNVMVGIAYHSVINGSVLLLAGVDRATLGWILPLFWIVAAAGFIVAGGLSAARLKNKATWAAQAGTSSHAEAWSRSSSPEMLSGHNSSDGAFSTQKGKAPAISDTRPSKEDWGRP